MYANVLPDYFDEDITVSVTNSPGANGLTAENRIAKADPGEGLVLFDTIISLFVNDFFRPDQSEFQAADFPMVGTGKSQMRSICISHHSTEIEDHFQWDWETYIDKVPDLKIGSASTSHDMIAMLTEKLSPRLEEGDITMVPFDSGGPIRAEIQKGNIDGYQPAFSNNYVPPRGEKYYKTQFVINDPERYPDQCEPVYELTDDNVEGHFISQTPAAEENPEAAKRMVDLTAGGMLFMTVPGAPSDVVEPIRNAFSQAQQDESLKSQLEESQGDLRFVHSTRDGEQTQEVINEKYSVWESAIEDGFVTREDILGS
jgi:tripartite-type tricarboxylate transporter receptor subunit TctC